MYSTGFFKRVFVLVVVFVTAPLAFTGSSGDGRVAVGLNEACAESGTCCFRIGSICEVGPHGPLLDHYFEPSGTCPRADTTAIRSR